MEKLTSRSNNVCIKIRKLGKSKSFRDEQGLFLCDGHKLLREAVRYGADIELLLTTGDLDIELSQQTQVYKVDDTLLDSLSPLKNSQDVLFACRIKGDDACDFKSGIHLLLDNVQDPGNVGTIIRSAHAFGAESVILCNNSADAYNPKTIRATMGAIFKQRVLSLSTDQIFDIKNSGATFIGASNDIEANDLRQASLKDVIIVLGNEGQGISKELLNFCNEMIYIPISSDCESINVAAAASIILWQSCLPK
jgi:TrmH family RNA methyltransferase